MPCKRPAPAPFTTEVDLHGCSTRVYPQRLSYPPRSILPFAGRLLSSLDWQKRMIGLVWLPHLLQQIAATISHRAIPTPPRALPSVSHGMRGWRLQIAARLHLYLIANLSHPTLHEATLLVSSHQHAARWATLTTGSRTQMLLHAVSHHWSKRS